MNYSIMGRYPLQSVWVHTLGAGDNTLVAAPGAGFRIVVYSYEFYGNSTGAKLRSGATVMRTFDASGGSGAGIGNTQGEYHDFSQYSVAFVCGENEPLILENLAINAAYGGCMYYIEPAGHVHEELNGYEVQSFCIEGKTAGTTEIIAAIPGYSIVLTDWSVRSSTLTVVAELKSGTTVVAKHDLVSKHDISGGMLPLASGEAFNLTTDTDTVDVMGTYMLVPDAKPLQLFNGYAPKSFYGYELPTAPDPVLIPAAPAGFRNVVLDMTSNSKLSSGTLNINIVSGGATLWRTTAPYHGLGHQKRLFLPCTPASDVRFIPSTTLEASVSGTYIVERI